MPNGNQVARFSRSDRGEVPGGGVDAINRRLEYRFRDVYYITIIYTAVVEINCRAFRRWPPSRRRRLTRYRTNLRNTCYYYYIAIRAIHRTTIVLFREGERKSERESGREGGRERGIF